MAWDRCNARATRVGCPCTTKVGVPLHHRVARDHAAEVHSDPGGSMKTSRGPGGRARHGGRRRAGPPRAREGRSGAVPASDDAADAAARGGAFTFTPAALDVPIILAREETDAGAD